MTEFQELPFQILKRLKHITGFSESKLKGMVDTLFLKDEEELYNNATRALIEEGRIQSQPFKMRVLVLVCRTESAFHKIYKKFSDKYPKFTKESHLEEWTRYLSVEEMCGTLFTSDSINANVIIVSPKDPLVTITHEILHIYELFLGFKLGSLSHNLRLICKIFWNKTETEMKVWEKENPRELENLIKICSVESNFWN